MSAVHDDYRAWKAWDDRPFGRYTPLDARAYALELSRAGLDLGRPLCVLEIGFGAGEFAGWARDQGLTHIGIELDPTLVARARQAGFEAFGAGRALSQVAPERRFDLVAAFDVLEHMSLEEIAALLQAVRPRLTATGRVLARFPSGDSPFAATIQNGDVTHRTAIGSGMAQQLALASGYEVIQIRAPTLPILGVGLRRGLRRGLVTLARRAIGWTINLIFHEGRPQVMDPNMVIVLAPRRGPRAAP